MAEPVCIFCKGDNELYVAIRGNKVVLATANPEDESQHWFKDQRGTGNVTDDDGHRPFALVNKATGQALVNKHRPRPEDDLTPVQLAPYNGSQRVDLSMLWTEGDDLGGGYRELRALRDVTKTLNGLWGNVKDGTEVGICPSYPTDVNALWRMAPVGYNKDI